MALEEAWSRIFCVLVPGGGASLSTFATQPQQQSPIRLPPSLPQPTHSSMNQFVLPPLPPSPSRTYTVSARRFSAEQKRSCMCSSTGLDWFLQLVLQVIRSRSIIHRHSERRRLLLLLWRQCWSGFHDQQLSTACATDAAFRHAVSTNPTTIVQRA